MSRYEFLVWKYDQLLFFLLNYCLHVKESIKPLLSAADKTDYF